MFSQTEWPLRIQKPDALRSLWPVHLAGQEAISEVYRYQVGLLADVEVPFKEFLGKRVQLTLELSPGQPRVINGIISQVSRGNPVFVQSVNKQLIRYDAEVVPGIWLLSLNQTYRIFQDADTPTILGQVLKNQKVDLKLREKYVARTYCTQYGESDLNFVCRLMEEEGIYFFFEQGSDQETLVLIDHPDSVPYIPDRAVGFAAPAVGRGLFGLDLEQQITAGKASTGDLHFERAHQDLWATQPVSDQVEVGATKLTLRGPVNQDLERYEFPGRFARWLDEIDKDGSAQSAAMDKLTDLQPRAALLAAQRLACEAVRAVAEGNCERLTAGAKFDLIGSDLLDHLYDGTYLVTRVEHEAGLTLNDPAGGEEFHYRNRLECRPIGIPYRPPLRTARPVAAGIDTAVVTGPAKSDVFTDKHGRVRVQFHWDRSAASGLTGADGNTLPSSNYWPGSSNGPTTSSAWVRVMQTWAGPNFGELILPRVGQEVAVVYLEGDPDAPMIQGCLYNSKNMPPFADNLEHSSGIRTRSIGGKAGKSSGLVFDDTKGSELINLHSERDLAVGAEKNVVNNVGGYAVTNVAGGWNHRVGSLPGIGGGSGGGGGGGGDGEDWGWTVGKISASLGKDFQLIYGAYFSGASPVYAGELLGLGKYDLIVSPAALLGSGPATLLANKAILGGRNDFILGNKFDLLAARSWTALGTAKKEFVLWDPKNPVGSATAMVTQTWYRFLKLFAATFGILVTVEFWVLGGAAPAIASNTTMAIVNLVVLGVLGLALLILYTAAKYTLGLTIPTALFADLITRATLVGNLTVAAAALKAAAGAQP